MQTQFIPQLPENAPFTPEQRAYLNGFFAGLFARTAVAPGATLTPAAKPLEPLTILFGSQTGNCENLAKRIAKEAGKRGFAPKIHDLAKYPAAQLASEARLLVVTSTYGDGEPPDNANSFWEILSGAGAPKLEAVKFSVCALGDMNYPKFCGFGKEVDERLEMLGATRVHPRADCDVEYEEPFAKWVDGALGALSAAARPLTPALSPSEGEREDRRQPFDEAVTAGGRAVLEMSGDMLMLSPLPLGGGEDQGEGEPLLMAKKSLPPRRSTQT